jgi:antitoxin component HigA of HigAB toxin-antitoxin module
LEPSNAPFSTLSASIQPTDCYELYGITEEDIINRIGSKEPIPEDAIKIINGENVKITIEITQLWTEDVNLSFFIQYHSDTHESVCEPIPDFFHEDTITKVLECYDGWTDVGIFIYFDDVIIEECEECRPPDSDEESVVAYYFELPCEPICESLEPTHAPSILKPSASIQPTDCYELYGITEEDIINQIGSKEPIPEDAIKIIHGENATVTIGKHSC